MRLEPVGLLVLGLCSAISAVNILALFFQALDKFWIEHDKKRSGK